jgi:hypothetical protein
VLVREAEAAEHRRVPLAPGVAARVLEPGLSVGIAPQRDVVVRAARHRIFEAPQLLLHRDEVGGPAEDVLAQRQLALERRALVVERHAGSLAEGELAAVELGLPDEGAQQRRLARAVRPGERDAIAPVDLERDAVEERVARDLLAQAAGDQDGHAAKRSGVEASTSGKGSASFVEWSKA